MWDIHTLSLFFLKKNIYHMIKQTLTLAFCACLSLGASAQNTVPDAAWCSVIEKAFGDQGVPAKITCDLENGHHMLRVITPTRTYSYNVPERSNLPDFSTPVNIAVDDLDFRSPYRTEYRANYHGDRRGEYVGDRRAWMGQHNSLHYPDEVFTIPADVDFLESAIRSTVARLNRVNLVDYRFANQQRDAQFYVLRTTVLALQRGESFKEELAKDAKANEGKPGGRPGGAANGPVQRKVDRTFACAQLHLELVDYQTGSVVWSRDLSSEDYEISALTNPMEVVINKITRQLGEQMQALYPTVAPRGNVSGPVVRALEEKKEKTQSIYVGLGTDMRLCKGDQLTVYVRTNINGHSGREQVGTVTVTDVQGPDLCVCKVKKGEKDIYAALHSGALLYVSADLK